LVYKEMFFTFMIFGLLLQEEFIKKDKSIFYNLKLVHIY